MNPLGARWTPRRAMLVLIGTNLLWAGTYVAGKSSLRSLSPPELNCLRFGIAGLAFLPLLWWFGRGLRIERKHVPRLALLCLYGFILNKAAEFSGLKLTTASDTALLIASEGLFTAFFGWLLLREAIRRSALAGLLLSIVGVYLVIQRGLVLPRLGSGTRIAGDLLVVAALVFEALYTVLGKAELERYSGLVFTAACTIGSLLVWVPAAAIDIGLHGLPRMDSTEWSGVLYLALAGTVLAYIGWFAALRYVDAATAAPTLFLQPLIGTILAVLVLGDKLTWATLVGGCLIIAGIWIVTRNEDTARTVVAGAEVLA